MTPKRQAGAKSVVSRRLHGHATTIFAEMSALATRTNSINLGQGFPDESGPESVIDQAIQAMRDGVNQYPPGHGNPDLIEAIRAHQARHYGQDLSPAQVVVTSGATEAIAAAILALVDPGDEVITIDPAYDSYPAMIAFAGGVRRAVTLQPPDFAVDLDALESAVSPSTKVLLCNTPHNPTGRVFSRRELAGLAELAIRHDLIVISDEVYEHLTFAGHSHLPIATLPGMSERTITISSSGKTFSLTGWKIGWAMGPAPLISAVEGAKNWLSYSSGAPFQPAIAHALNHEEAFHLALRDALQHKRELLGAGLRELGLTVFEPQGTYFINTDVRPLGFANGIDFCSWSAEHARVVAVPSQGFYADTNAGAPYVRWAFCKRESVLAEAVARLSAATSQL